MRAWLRGLSVGLCAATLLALAPAARSDVVSDQAGAILVVPKVVVDTSRGIDTLVQISNISSEEITLQCFYVNATPTCATGPLNCIEGQRFSTLEQCPARDCVQQWQETDFHVVLTGFQPVAWLASRGAVDCRRIEPVDDNNPNNNIPCFPLDGFFRKGGPFGDQSNEGSNVPPVGQDPFVGELKCIAVDDAGRPVPRNDVYGHITISGSMTGDRTDLAGYNIISIRALEDNNGDNTLVLGPVGIPDRPVEYNGCPAVLVLDHFFDFGVDPISGEPVVTDLTLVPCSEDFNRQEVQRTTLQFLVFNEFEQRFSTSRALECFREIQISNIDTMTNNLSIFSAQVAGTLTGQTRIRGVTGTDPNYGNGVLAIAEEFRRTGTAAWNLQTQGVRPQRDYIYLPGQ